MARFRSLDEIKAAQRADAMAAELRVLRWEQRHRPGSIAAWAHRWTKTLKAVAGTLGAASLVLSGLAVGSAKIYRGARKVYVAITMMRARNIAPAELPATGVASTAIDRVDKPSAPEDRPAARPGSDRSAP